MRTKRQWGESDLYICYIAKTYSPSHAGRREKREAREGATEPFSFCNFFMHERKRGQVLMPAFLGSHTSQVPSAHTACSQYSCCKLSAVGGEEETIWVEGKTAVFRKQVSLDQTVLYHSRKWAFPCVITRQADLPGRPFGFDFLLASALLCLH